MELGISATKEIILNQIRNGTASRSNKFDNYQKMYAFTNENIKSYLKILKYADCKNALSVLSSGDHVFNLISKGILNIDTFDTNRLTEYYALGFKRALILKYNYEEFKQIVSTLSSPLVSVEEISEILYGLLSFMEPIHRKYWEEIIYYNYNLQKNRINQLNLLDLITLGIFLDEALYYNSYLSNEENYNALRRNLTLANITFKYSNALDLSKNFSSEYDAILLSNILDYFCPYWGARWKYEKLEKYSSELECITKNNGIIFLNYLFLYGNIDLNQRKYVIHSSSVRKQDLRFEDIVFLEKRFHMQVGDAMLLKRVRK